MSAEYLLCGQILLVPSSLPDKYPDTYGLIYQPLSRQNYLSHIFNLYSLWQLHHSLNVIFTMVGKHIDSHRHSAQYQYISVGSTHASRGRGRSLPALPAPLTVEGGSGRLVAPPGYIYPVTWVITPRPPPPLPALRPGAGADKPRQLY